MEITRGKGADVIFDPIGKDTFKNASRCFKLARTMVGFGPTSCPVLTVSLSEVSAEKPVYLVCLQFFSF